MPKVSIIVPIYNVDKYLDRCIESILNQTFNDFELILVNDGSKDKCKEIINFYFKKDDRIRIINKENGGVSSARNAGINIAEGDFIGFVDPDDYLELDAIEYIYKLAVSNNSNIVAYRMNTYKSDTLISNMPINENIEIYSRDKAIIKQLNDAYFLYSVCNKLFSKRMFDNTRFSEDIRYAEDALFNYEMLLKTDKIVISNLRKYNYVINDEGIVSNINHKRLDILDAQKRIYEILRDEYPKNSKEILKQYITSSIGILIDVSKENYCKENRKLIKMLRKKVNYDKNLLKNIKLDSKKISILFFMTKKFPSFVIILYKLRFYFFNKWNCNL